RFVRSGGPHGREQAGEAHRLDRVYGRRRRTLVDHAWWLRPQLGLVIDAIDELLGWMVPSAPTELRPRGDLDDGAHVAASLHRQAHHAHHHVQDLLVVILHADAVVLCLWVPHLELDHQVYPLAIAHRGDAVQILDVQDAEAAHFHVVAQRRCRLAEDHPRRPIIALDHVIGDEPMSLHHELERALALADAALADQQHTHLENVDQDAMNARAWRQMLIEHRVQRRD